MDWQDCHPHKFGIIDRHAEILVFGTVQGEPDEVFSEGFALPDWEHKLSEYEDILPKAFTTYIYTTLETIGRMGLILKK